MKGELILLITACTFAIIPWVMFGYYFRHYWGYMAVPVFWLLHIIIFGIVVIVGTPFSNVELNTWSSAIRLQGILSSALLGFFMYKDFKRNGFNGYH